MAKDNLLDFSVFKAQRPEIETLSLSGCMTEPHARQIARKTRYDLQDRARRISLSDAYAPDSLETLAGKEEPKMPEQPAPANVYGLKEARQAGFNEGVAAVTQRVEAMFTALDIQLRQKGKEDDADLVRRHAVQSWRAVCEAEGWPL